MPRRSGRPDRNGRGGDRLLPPGSAFCIFFGPTPASEGAVPRAASDVNPLGRVEGDASRFTRVPDGAPVTLEWA